MIRNVDDKYIFVVQKQKQGKMPKELSPRSKFYTWYLAVTTVVLFALYNHFFLMDRTCVLEASFLLYVFQFSFVFSLSVSIYLYNLQFFSFPLYQINNNLQKSSNVWAACHQTNPPMLTLSLPIQFLAAVPRSKKNHSLFR